MSNLIPDDGWLDCNGGPSTVLRKTEQHSSSIGSWEKAGKKEGKVTEEGSELMSVTLDVHTIYMYIKSA